MQVTRLATKVLEVDLWDDGQLTWWLSDPISDANADSVQGGPGSVSLELSRALKCFRESIVLTIRGMASDLG
jgi:hypothetical protein